jgi:hypothetical protein
LPVLSEAEYAFESRKHIIPLRLQATYKADDWLGFIQGSKFLNDFTKKEQWRDKLKQLLIAVQKVYETTGTKMVQSKNKNTNQQEL